MRRAYFDCRFGQLHVRTAFPTTGGFDEGTTLICLHPAETTGRIFSKFLAEIAVDRSVYAPDLPGCGESDPGPLTATAAGLAVADLVADLRLRQIDVLGFRFGATAALDLTAVQPALVRRLVLVAAPPLDAQPGRGPVPEPAPKVRSVAHESLVLRVKAGEGDDSGWTAESLARPTFIELDDYAADLFEAAPKTLAKHIGDFLRA